MIVHDKLSWLQLLFSIRGTSIGMTWRRILFVLLVSIGVTVSYHQFAYKAYLLTPLPFTLVGLAISIFLGFRNSESYERFWEGRKLWGQLVNTSRSLTRQITTLIHPTDASEDPAKDAHDCVVFRRETVYRLIGYVHALRHHLRGTDPFEDLAPFFPCNEISELRLHKNVPVGILQILGWRVQSAWQRGWIHEYYRTILEDSLTQLTSIQGGCERIKATPLPYAYTVLIHRIVGAYCTLLPFGIVDSVGVMTPAVTLLISHAFFGLDAIGDEIEEPFGFDHNDLPLETLSRMIEVNLKQLLGELDVPEFLKSDRGLFH